MQFKHSIENFRGISILFVIFSHLGSYRYSGEIGNHIYFLFGGGTTWFVFISGYLFAHLEPGPFHYQAYLKKKFKFIIVPYLMFSLLGITAGIRYGHPQLLGLSDAAYAGWSLVVGGAVIYPLWYIPMITLFFLATPVFHGLRHHRAWLYGLTAVGLLFSLFWARPVLNTNPFIAFLHYVGIYLLGVSTALNAKAISALSLKWTLALMAAGALVFLAAGAFYPGFDPGASHFRDNGQLDLMQLGKLGLLATVFLGFEKFFNQRNALLSYVARISFGLYFVHGLFMGSFSGMSQHIEFTSDASMIFAEAAVVIASSFITVWILKKVLGKRSRYVIGC